MHAPKMDSMALLQQQVLIVTVLCPIAQNVNLWHGLGVEVRKLRIELPAFRQAITGCVDGCTIYRGCNGPLARSGSERHCFVISALCLASCKYNVGQVFISIWLLCMTFEKPHASCCHEIPEQDVDIRFCKDRRQVLVLCTLG